MNENEMTKKKNFKAYGALLFCLVFFVFWLFFLCNDIFTHNGLGKIIQDSIWLGIFGIASFGYFHDARNMNITNNNDERDSYIEMKTGKLMFNIRQRLIFILGAITLISALILGKSMGTTAFLVMELMTITVTLLTIWNLLLIIWLIVTFINYRKN